MYYLIGEHLGHSFSAEIHRTFGRYDYELRELAPAELGPFLEARDFAGLNVTIPYKEAVIPYLDRLDGEAAAIGAVNTVVNRDGLLWGYNTDFGGMKASLERLCRPGAGPAPPRGSETVPRLSLRGQSADLSRQSVLSGKTVLILGTGGTSKTAQAVCKALGAAQIYRVSRTGREGALTYPELLQGSVCPELLINCTPVGTWPDPDGLPLDLKTLQFRHSERPKGLALLRSEESASPVLSPSLRGQCAHWPWQSASPVPAVFDCVYNPLRTRLILEARSRGLPAMGGLCMLVKQAALACARFTGLPVEDEQVDSICDSLRRDRENLVLIGMPGAGKTTVARILAQKTGRVFVDSDEEITKRAGKSIPAIFAEDGEAAFRELEAAIIREAALRSGCVLATGGGTVLREENLRRLRQTGRLILLDRPPEALEPSPDRPLGDTPEKVAALYAERYQIYLRAADRRVPVNGTPEDAAEAVLAAL